MAKEQEAQSGPHNDTAALIQQVIQALAQSGAFGQQKSPAQAELEILQAKKLKKEIETEEQQEFLRRKAHEEGAKSMEQRRKQEEAKQAQCSHMLELNGGPAVACQRDHNQNFIFLCQMCQKIWMNGEIPINLRIPVDRIGGPMF